jgi:retron-type reverse transcriptase
MGADGRYNGLIQIISDVNYLIVCYDLIKGKPGNMIPGLTSETLDRIDVEYFKRLSNLLKSGRFTFSPSRKIMRTKSGKKDLRPISIGSGREKIVQKAITLVLESIYEPLFNNQSHGFRPNRGVHSALHELYLKGGNYS